MAGKPAARVQVKGARELRAAMKAAGADMRDLTRANKRAADIVKGFAQDTAPRESGALASSHKSRASKSSARVLAGTDEGGAVPYAGVIHFGWPAHNIEGSFWLYAAAEVKEDDVVNVYEGAVEAVIRKIDLMTPG